MEVVEHIRKDLKEAMKAREMLRTEVLRGLLSAFTNEVISKGKKPDESPTDQEALTVIKRQVKQRDDSIQQYTDAGREELAEKEEQERKILASYLPETMSQEEIEKVAIKKKEELGITEPSEKGKLIGAVMKELGDKADGSDVKSVVEHLFTAN